MAFNELQIDNLKLLLQLQAEGYKDSIDRLYATVRELQQDYSAKIVELTTSLEFSQKCVDDLKKEVKLLQTENEKKSTRDQIIDFQLTNIKQIERQVAKQEDYSRRNNIRIDGMVESPQENNEQIENKILKLMKDKFNLDNVSFQSAHRIRNSQKLNSDDYNKDMPRPRTVIARLTNVSDRNIILKNKWKLKSTGIYINEDVSEHTAKSRLEQLPKLKDAKRSGKIAFFIGEKLIIENKKTENQNLEPATAHPSDEHEEDSNPDSPERTSHTPPLLRRSIRNSKN